jgi:hypothetical protein
MFSKIYNWFVGVEHDIEAIIENFTSTIVKLEAAAEAKAKHAIEFAQRATHFEALSDVAQQEATRAKEVAEKIKGLVS